MPLVRWYIFVIKAELKERPYICIWNGFWCIVVTVLTVGYGVIAIIACLWGTFLISVIVISLTNSIEFTTKSIERKGVVADTKRC